MSEFCQVERDGRLLTVTIDRPEVMNALHPPANQELEKVFDAFVRRTVRWATHLVTTMIPTEVVMPCRTGNCLVSGTIGRFGSTFGTELAPDRPCCVQSS